MMRKKKTKEKGGAGPAVSAPPPPPPPPPPPLDLTTAVQSNSDNVIKSPKHKGQPPLPPNPQTPKPISNTTTDNAKTFPSRKPPVQNVSAPADFMPALMERIKMMRRDTMVTSDSDDSEDGFFSESEDVRRRRKESRATEETRKTSWEEEGNKSEKPPLTRPKSMSELVVKANTTMRGATLFEQIRSLKQDESSDEEDQSEEPPSVLPPREVKVKQRPPVPKNKPKVDIRSISFNDHYDAPLPPAPNGNGPDGGANGAEGNQRQMLPRKSGNNGGRSLGDQIKAFRTDAETTSEEEEDAIKPSHAGATRDKNVADLSNPSQNVKDQIKLFSGRSKVSKSSSTDSASSYYDEPLPNVSSSPEKVPISDRDSRGKKLNKSSNVAAMAANLQEQLKQFRKEEDEKADRKISADSSTSSSSYYDAPLPNSSSFAAGSNDATSEKPVITTSTIRARQKKGLSLQEQLKAFKADQSSDEDDDDEGEKSTMRGTSFAKQMQANSYNDISGPAETSTPTKSSSSTIKSKSRTAKRGNLTLQEGIRAFRGDDDDSSDDDDDNLECVNGNMFGAPTTFMQQHSNSSSNGSTYDEPLPGLSTSQSSSSSSAGNAKISHHHKRIKNGSKGSLREQMKSFRGEDDSSRDSYNGVGVFELNGDSESLLEYDAPLPDMINDRDVQRIMEIYDEHIGSMTNLRKRAEAEEELLARPELKGLRRQFETQSGFASGKGTLPRVNSGSECGPDGRLSLNSPIARQLLRQQQSYEQQQRQQQSPLLQLKSAQSTLRLSKSASSLRPFETTSSSSSSSTVSSFESSVSRTKNKENKNSKMDDESVSSGEAAELLLIRIRVNELNIEKCLQFQKEELIWEVKQQSLAALPKELTESFNYGLFLPPANGKAGKFLDEERRLSEYPFSGPIGYLELKYKRRVYKMLQLDEKQLKSVNSRANLKKFVEHVQANHVDKVNKMCAKGLDPNFHCQDTGETPLCLSACLRPPQSSKSSSSLSAGPTRMIMSLVNGGALVDFRAKDGATAVHRAVARGNVEALKVLLDLGASPNYKDAKGLTPLYLSVLTPCPAAAEVALCETLLHDHAAIGAQDLQGWQEVHQACRNGLVHHLERLLFYGADLDARNASGNTPLHVCAVNGQESCARTLLFRGADRAALNFAGQTPYQVAVIAGNLELAEVIQQHRGEDVVPYKEAPKYNPRRRPLAAAAAGNTNSGLSRANSDVSSVLQQQSPLVHGLIRRPPSTLSTGVRTKPPSPSPSDRSLPPFSSGSSVSETSTGSGGSTTIGSGPGSGSGSVLLLPPPATVGNQRLLQQQILPSGFTAVEEEQLDSASALAAAFTNDASNALEVLSLSSGVGTSSSQSGSAGEANGASLQLQPVPHGAAASTSPRPLSAPQQPHHHQVLVQPGMHVVCLENHSSPDPNCLHITQGDIIEVTGSTDDGMLEGLLRGRSGLFPSHCVQEVRLRNPDAIRQQQQQQQQQNMNAISLAPPQSPSRVVGRRDQAAANSIGVLPSASASSTPTMQRAKTDREIFEEAMRSKKQLLTHSRKCVLKKGRKGFGFVLRGAKASSPLMDMIPSEKCPGLQYMDDVDEGGVAELAGIKKGDFLLEINGKDVTTASHETVVNLIRKSGDSVKLTVVTVPNFLNHVKKQQQQQQRPYSSATLPRMPLPAASNGGSSPNPPPPPRRDPNTTLSVGRAKARSMVANLSAIEALDRAISEHDSSSVTGTSDSASISSAVALTAMATSATVEQRMPADGAASNNTASSPAKVYASVHDMKKAKQPLNQVVVSADINHVPKANDSSSSNNNDLVAELNWRNASLSAARDDLHGVMTGGSHGGVDQQRGYFTLPGRGGANKRRAGSVESELPFRLTAGPPPASLLPPPDHPPPPPPTSSQLVPVKSSDYASPSKSDNLAKPSPTHSAGSGASTGSGGVRSSFKPSDSAKLYASPENVQSVAFREQKQQQQVKKRSPTRANSMPPRPTRPQVLRRSMIAEVPLSASTSGAPAGTNKETYSVNGVNYTTYTTFRSPITPDEVPEGYQGVSGRQMFDSDLTPTNAASDAGDVVAASTSTPHIPEPDYDLSDEEDRENRRRAATMERKKKSVTFVMDEEDAAHLAAAAAATAKKKQPESILKDTSREREREYQAQQQQRQAAIALASDPDRCFNRIPHARIAPAGEAAQPDKKVRIALAAAGTQTSKTSAASLARSNSLAAGTARSNGGSVSLQKSKSFSSDKHPHQTTAECCHHQRRVPNEMDVRQGRSQLKPSRSFPQELANEEGENSSSGVSSDQEANGGQSTGNGGANGGGAVSRVEVKYVTRLPVEGPPKPEVVPSPPNNSNGNSRRWENASESSEDSSERSWMLRSERDPADPSNHILSMSRQMLHPKLQALFDKPGGAAGASTATLPSMKAMRMAAAALDDGHDSTLSSMSSSSGGSSVYGQQQQQSLVNNSKTLPNRKKSASTSTADERSISESLALIQHHVSTLGDVNKLVVGDEQQQQGAVQPPVLKPPPGFSDSEGFSDNESLSSGGSQSKAGKMAFGKISQPARSHVAKQKALKGGGIMSKSMDSSGFNSSSSMMSRSVDYGCGGGKEAFKSKPLMGWTSSDVCEWLDSIFLPEHRESFARAGVDGLRLAGGLTKRDLEALGVVRPGHALNIERSLKKYLN